VRFETALQHARMVQEYEIDPIGAALEFRKHLGWYVKGLPGSAELRKRLHQVSGFGEVEGIFADYLAMRVRGDIPDDSRELEGELLEAEHA
jgi:tRNA-dihydrouridine synthase